MVETLRQQLRLFRSIFPIDGSIFFYIAGVDPCRTINNMDAKIKKPAHAKTCAGLIKEILNFSIRS